MIILSNIKLKNIGQIESSYSRNSGNKKDIISNIVINKKYQDALKGIEDYSHIIVLFWLNKITNKEREYLTVHPRGIEDIPEVGIFSTRNKVRPNPIGLTIVELISRKDNILKVKGLDAFNGTPILDIKPYDIYDIKNNIKVPNWWKKLTSKS